MSEVDWAALKREGARRFGVQRFRPGQRELIEAVLRGQAMMRFAQSPLCRRKLLREYFGEDRGDDCGNCDNCRSGMTRVASDRPLRKRPEISA